jgi:hypothetical protein
VPLLPENAVSGGFKVVSRVRRGGGLSSVLLAIYVDDILERLRRSQLGCTVVDMYTGCVLYVDDLIISSTSLTMLQSMLLVSLT